MGEQKRNAAYQLPPPPGTSLKGEQKRNAAYQFPLNEEQQKSGNAAYIPPIPPMGEQKRNAAYQLPPPPGTSLKGEQKINAAHQIPLNGEQKRKN